MSEKLYQAVKSGQIRVQDLNEDGKAALKNYILTKNSAASTPEQVDTSPVGMGDLKTVDVVNPPSGMGGLREYDRVEPEANIGASFQKGIIDRADTMYGGIKPPPGTEPNPWQLPSDFVYTDEKVRNYQPQTGW
ncbi:MAG: hypothetical protein ACYC4H_12905, partial [Desulfocucumaceae bacterium]